MRLPGRLPPLFPAFSRLLLFVFLVNTHHHARANAKSISSVHIAEALLPSSTTLGTSSTKAITAATPYRAAILTTTTQTTTHSSIHYAPTNSTPASTKALATPQPIPSKAPLPYRCKPCPANNTLGLICFKNTICVPLTLLCDSGSMGNTSTSVNTTASFNPCMDTTGPASTTDPIYCQDQLCYPKNFLPIPYPGKGKIDRNSSANCITGSYFSLYGSSDTGGSMRYTQSCASQFPLSNPSIAIVCKDWEYSVQNTCLLRTCGPSLDCESPFTCRRSNKTGTLAPYGLCMSPNSTGDPGGEDTSSFDPPTSKDRLLLGILVGICSLFLGIGVGTAVCLYRKQRLRQLVMFNQDSNDGTVNQKSSFWTTLHTYFDACCCCFLGSNVGLRDSGLNDETRVNNTRDTRVESVTEPDGQESSLTTNYRTNLIFARRWRWGVGRHAGEGDSSTRVGLTPGGMAVLPEIEPPPLYHQGPDLPTYRDRNSIMLTPVSEPPRAVDQINPTMTSATV